MYVRSGVAAETKRVLAITGQLAPIQAAQTQLSAVGTASPYDGIVLNKEKLEFKGKSAPRKEVTREEWKAMEGQEVGVSQYIEVSQDRVDAFAVTTLDPQWIHLRGAKEKGSPFGGPIAHGYLVVSLSPFLAEEIMPRVKGAKMGVNFGVEKLRFVSAVHVGKKIRMRVKLVKCEDIQSPGGKGNGGVQNTLGITMEVENSDKPAVVWNWITRTYF